jgi:hypothetical protein
VEEFVKVYVFPSVAVNVSPKAIGVEGAPTALPFKAIEDAEAPVNEVPTTRSLVPTFAVPVSVIRLFVEVIATAPEDLICVVTFMPRVPFPVRDRVPTLFVPSNKELVKDAVLGAIAPTLKEPVPE